jgi:hypothetical protein
MSAVAAPENRPGVPDHELLRQVGRGSYGEVWLARSVMGSFRAVKVVYRASFDSDRPYEREFGGLQKFEPVSRTHPGLVSILHIGRNTESGCFYCVMEVADDMVAGQAIEPDQYQPRTLACELVKRGRFPLDECLDLGIALAAALGHLHSHGLVHRDIKPSNIIFVNGVPKLADIGLVTQIGTKATFVGTEGYLPPEGPGSPGADLYSLGRVIYEISLGQSQEQFPELPTRLRELPDAAGLMRLNALVLQACDPQAAKRFRSAEDFRAALAELRAEYVSAGAGASARGTGRTGAGRKAVILCSAEAPADAALAKRFKEKLAGEGFMVFLDDHPTLGLDWARRIEQQIRGAQAVLPILSPASAHSECMAYALEVASQAARRPTRLPTLVPVLLQLRDPLPPQMALALEGASSVSADSAADADQAAQRAVDVLVKALAPERG